MKKIILSLIFIALALITNAHIVSPLCWSQGKYSFNATQVPNGIATVKVYSNSNYTGLIETKSITVLTGQIVYDVNQSVRTTKVYVKVTWSDNYVNQNASGTNQCVVQSILGLEVIDAKNVGNSTIIHFRAESTTDNELITINLKLFNSEIKSYDILMWTTLNFNDIWEVTINNLTNQVLTVKKK